MFLGDQELQVFPVLGLTPVIMEFLGLFNFIFFLELLLFR